MADQVKPESLLGYSKALAVKLRDPVDDGGTDGKIFHADHRFLYLTRGFGKFLRNLEAIGVEPETIYPDFYNIYNKKYENETVLNGISLKLTELVSSPAFTVFRILAKKKDGKTFLRGRETKITNLFEMQFGLFAVNYDPTKSTSNFYWGIVSGSIMFIADTAIKITDISILLENPLPEFTVNSTTDLYIPRKYEDLFLSNCALEMAIDTGQTNKVNLYNSEIAGQLTLLKLKVERSKQEEKVDSVN